MAETEQEEVNIDQLIAKLEELASTRLRSRVRELRDEIQEEIDLLRSEVGGGGGETLPKASKRIRGADRASLAKSDCSGV
jgi:hypothetical protein